MEQQWSPGVIVAFAIFAIGLAVGAVGTAIAFSPLEALETVAKTQNIIAACVALLAAGIAYKAQTVKVASDERARWEDQQSKIDAIRDEVMARNKKIMLLATRVVADIARLGAQGAAVSMDAGASVLRPAVVTAAARVPSLWAGVEMAPRHVRRQTVDLLIAHGQMVTIVEEFAGSLAEWASSANLTVMFDDVLTLARGNLENVQTIEQGTRHYD